tara:strand:- start:131336 stop:131599 length:264 start_codon:yes stop_codon:yes gene_type:complete
MILLFFTQMLASAGYVLFRCLQQLNSVYLRWLWILPTSLCIALCEVFVIQMIATSDLSKMWLVLSTGLGGTIGCFGAMYISNKWGKK